MQISVKGDTKRLTDRANWIEKQVLPQAMNGALNRAGPQGVNASVREVAKEERIPQQRLKERVRQQRSNWRTLTFNAHVSRQTITYYSLGNQKQTRTGVTVGGGRTRRRLAGAFIASTRRGQRQIFRRKGPHRYPLEVPRKYIGNPMESAFRHHWKHTARPVYVRELRRELARRVKMYLKK